LKEAGEITKYLFENILQWTEEDIKKKLKNSIFAKNKLGAMLLTVFNNSYQKALNNAYPNKYKEWELPIVTNGFWTEDKTIEAIKWLLEEKLKWSYNDVINNLSVKTLREYNLSKILHLYRGSIYKLLIKAYPNKDWFVFSTNINKSRRNRFIKINKSI
jgi:hypothetical protein